MINSEGEFCKDSFGKRGRNFMKLIQEVTYGRKSLAFKKLCIRKHHGLKLSIHTNTIQNKNDGMGH